VAACGLWRVKNLTSLILRRRISAFTRVFDALWPPSRRMEVGRASWFETRFALLTMRV